MNIKDLGYFVAVAELEHFGRAAERCGVSQPTLSSQIKKLEETLGVKLFERTNRRVMLTQSGKRIFTYAKHALQEVDAIYQTAASERDPKSGEFRLGAFPTLSTYIFPKIVPKIKAALPDLKLLLIEEKTADLIKKLKDGEVDAALLSLPFEDDLLHSCKYFEDAFFLAVPSGHKLAQHKAVSQTVLKENALLLLEEGHCLRNQSLNVCKLYGVVEEQDFKASGIETLRQMVKAGTGITLMPEIAITEKDDQIHYIPFLPPAPSRSIGIFWRKAFPMKELMNQLIGIIK